MRKIIDEEHAEHDHGGQQAGAEAPHFLDQGPDGAEEEARPGPAL